MKKIFMYGVMALSLVSLSATQSRAQGSVVATLNVSDVITLTAPVAVVAYTLSGSSSYATNQAQTVTANLSVTSTRDWDVDVKTTAANFVFLTNNIPVSVLKVESLSTGLGGTHSAAFALSTTDQKLINEATAAVGATIDIRYTLLTNTNASSFNVPAGAYTATLVYTGSID